MSDLNEPTYNQDSTIARIGVKRTERAFCSYHEVYHAMHRLFSRLTEADISSALVGTLALNQHSNERPTTNIDTVMKREALEKFREQFLLAAST